MLNLNIYLHNPWYKENFQNLFNWSKKVTKNKVVEFEITRYAHDLLGIHLSTDFTGNDHAGPRFDLALLGYSVSIKMYDTRHWNYEQNDWQKYPDAVA